MEPEKTPRERAEDLINLLVSDWRPSPRQVVWAIRIVLATAVVLGLLTLVGWPFGITLWDWLKLLVVPAALAIAGLLFTSSQQRAAQADAERRAQDQAVQDYLDRIGQLLIDKDLRNERETTDLRQLARGHTLSVLERLDGRHKGSVLRFLYGAGLIYAGAGSRGGSHSTAPTLGGPTSEAWVFAAASYTAPTFWRIPSYEGEPSSWA